MKNIIYRFRKDKEQKTYRVEILKNGRVIEHVPDVFVKRKHIKKLVHVCNKYDVSPIHIHDIIEDMKYDMNMA